MTKLYYFFASNDEDAEIVRAPIGGPLTLSSGGRWLSLSSYYETEEELREKSKIQPECRECKRMYSIHYVPETEKRLKAQNLCFACDHWNGYWRRTREKGSVRVNGTQYIFDTSRPVEGGPSRWLGHGGSEFKIRFYDGREVLTNNLWCAGRIPFVWHFRIQDNAIFVR